MGNVGQLAIDILLTSLNEAKDVTLNKIGIICDRNLTVSVGNNALKSMNSSETNEKKNSDNNDESVELSEKLESNFNTEVYFYSEGNLCILQQRGQTRLGGRGEYVENLLNWIKECKFNKILLLTSEFLTSIDNETQLENISNNFDKRFVYYSNNNDVNNEIKNVLNWEISLKNEYLKNNKKPKSSLLADDENNDNTDEAKNNENTDDDGDVKFLK